MQIIWARPWKHDQFWNLKSLSIFKSKRLFSVNRKQTWKKIKLWTTKWHRSHKPRAWKRGWNLCQVWLGQGPKLNFSNRFQPDSQLHSFFKSPFNKIFKASELRITFSLKMLKQYQLCHFLVSKERQYLIIRQSAEAEASFYLIHPMQK